jgi:CDP-glycerol glycerophosphotransferase (TagB/SpsB family)
MGEGYFFSWPCYSSNDFEMFLQAQGILLLVKIHTAELTELNLRGTDSIRFISDEMLSTCDCLLFELLGATDAIITDYSSIAVDFLLLDKPIVYTVRDVDEYSEKHGLMTEPFDAWAPGEVVEDYEGLKTAIHNALFGEDKFKDKREQIRRIMHKYNDSESTRRVLDLARSLIDG